MVITGEGKIDSQTIYGKVPVGVAKIAKKYDIPVMAIGAIINKDAEFLHQYGIDFLVQSNPLMSLNYSKTKNKLIIQRSIKNAIEDIKSERKYNKREIKIK